MTIQWKTKAHILYCDQCHDLIMPGQRYVAIGSRLLCEACATDGTDLKEEE